jgi:hypothetical protein
MTGSAVGWSIRCDDPLASVDHRQIMSLLSAPTPPQVLVDQIDR